MTRYIKNLTIALTALACAAVGVADEPMQWHEDPHRNNIVKAEDLPDHIGDDNRLWRVDLHNRAFFNIITIEDGKVYCGMRADNLPDRQRSRGAGLLCLDLATGQTLWQQNWGIHAAYGLSSVPLIEGDRIYIRDGSKVYCLNAEDGSTLWQARTSQRYYAHMHSAHGTGLILGDYLWMPTGHATGSDDSYWYVNSLDHPFHPNIMVFDKKTGKLVAQDDIPVGAHQHGNWGGLSAAEIDGKQQVFWGDAHGIVHAFEAPGSFPEGKVSTLKEAWRCDANPREYRQMEDGTPMPYAAYMGPGPKEIGWCEIVSVPVYHEGKLYVTLGRDKAYSPGKQGRHVGRGGVVCIDPTGAGDVTDTHKLWFSEINRTFAVPSITDDGLLFVADHAGYLTCMDINDKGRILWTGDIRACIWNYFQAVGDEKVYVMNERRDFYIFQADRDGGQLFHKQMHSTNNPQVGMTDGILIVGTNRDITAYGGPEYMKTRKPMDPVAEKQFEEGEKRH